MLRAVLALCVLLLWPAAAHADKRIALLIGNQSYKSGVGALTNPLNDIRIVGEALKAVGFDVLKPAINARRADMLLAIHDFAGRLKAAGADAVGFLYYSGHGIASAGENYLVPIDIDEPSTLQLSVQGVRHSEVLAILRNEAPNAAHYLVLDACRNSLQGARGGKGFVPLGQQSGVLVAFAAEPGKTASDVGRGSGPYAAALATELVKPGQSDLIMFHNVRIAVMESTGGDQVPWTEDGIQRRQRVLFGGERAQTAIAPPVPAVAPARLSDAAEAWDRTKDATNIAVLEAFAVRFKDTFFAELARARIEELKKQQVAVAVPPPPTPAPPSKPDAGATAPGVYEVDKLSSITGRLIASRYITMDASKPEAGVTACARACDSTTGCTAFDINIVYSKCSLYADVQRKGSLGGYISGVRKPDQAAAAAPGTIAIKEQYALAIARDVAASERWTLGADLNVVWRPDALSGAGKWIVSSQSGQGAVRIVVDGQTGKVFEKSFVPR